LGGAGQLCAVLLLLLLRRQVKVCQPGNCQLERCRAQGVNCHDGRPFSFLQKWQTPAAGCGIWVPMARSVLALAWGKCGSTS
jgi:hypothetical protein